MKSTKEPMFAVTTTRILIGLTLLVAGLIKLFVSTPSGVTGMLSGSALFSWAPGFWAWVLILSEVICGLAIIANYKLRWLALPPIVIMVVAAFTMNWGKWSSLLMHLSLAAMYWTYSAYDNE